MPGEYIIQNLITHFKGRQSVPRDQVVAFLQSLEPDLNEQTISWRIHQLKDKGYITYVSRGVYSFVVKEEWQPTLTRWSKRLLNLIREENSNAELCIWHTEFLNAWTNCGSCHQFTFIEVDRTQLGNTFDVLMTLSKKVFLNPDAAFIDRYILPLSESIIVRPLVSEAPLMEVNEIPTSSLEKVLIDLVLDELFFKPVMGEEKIDMILMHAIDTFQVSQSRMLRYAGRRNQREKVYDHLKKLNRLIQK